MKDEAGSRRNAEYAAIWLPEDPVERAQVLARRAEAGSRVLTVHSKGEFENEPSDIALMKRELPGG